MSVEIIPTVVPRTLSDILLVQEMFVGVSERIHIDISDGIFANGETWNNPEELPIGFPRAQKFEVHLMVAEPDAEVNRWLSVNPSRIIFHNEATKHPVVLAEKIFSVGIEPVVAINLMTPLEELEGLVPDVTNFHLMSIKKIGKQGDTLDPEIFKKISSCKELFPDAILSIDGGVNVSNAHDLMLCGASKLCVGSALAKSKDPRAVYRKLLATVQA